MISAFFTGQVGDITLEIDVDDSKGNVTTEIVSMGSLRYEFDQTPDTLDIDRVQAVYSPFNVDIARFDDDGNDLYFRLIEATLTGGDPKSINVDMEIEDFQSNVFKFTFSLRNSDIETDERSRSVKLKLNPRLNLDATNEDLFAVEGLPKLPFEALIPRDPDTEEPETVTYECTGAGDYIKEGMNLVFDNDFETVVSTSKFERGGSKFDVFGATPTTNDDERFYMVNVTSEDGFIASGEELPESPGVGLVTVNSTNNQSAFLFRKSATSPIQIRPSVEGIRLVRIIGNDDADFDLQNINVGDVIIVNGDGYSVTNVVDNKNLDGISLDDQELQVFPPANTFVEGFLNQTFEDLGFVTQYGVNAIYTIVRRQVPEEIKVIKTLKDLAGIEGSFFGTGFSKNFYINRLSADTSNATTLFFDDIVNLKPKPFNLSIGGSKVTQLTDSIRLFPVKFGVWGTSFEDDIRVQPRIPNLQSATKYAVGNPNATKAIKIELPAGYPFLNKGVAVGGDAPIDPVINIEAINLRYDDNRAGDSCIASATTEYYANNAISLGFEGITDLYLDDTGSTFAPTGWYSNGTIVRRWNSDLLEPAFTEQYDCTAFPGVS